MSIQQITRFRSKYLPGGKRGLGQIHAGAHADDALGLAEDKASVLIHGAQSGGFGEGAGRLAQASPLLLPPLGIPQRLIHGAEDGHVPLAHSRRYLEAARAAGDAVELEEITGADHFDVIAPGSVAWARRFGCVSPLLLAAGPACIDRGQG